MADYAQVVSWLNQFDRSHLGRQGQEIIREVANRHPEVLLVKGGVLSKQIQELEDGLERAEV